MVSKLEIDGLRERAEVGVEGILEEENERACRSGNSVGNGSLNFDGANSGELCAAGLSAAVLLVGKVALAT
jgi:hypothetical protein